MLEELPFLLPESTTVGTDYHIRCFGHIINLAVKAFLSLFDSSPKAVKADEYDENEQDKATSDDEDAPDEDEEGFDEDEEDERDTGDWDEIAELSASLDEVAELDANDKLVGRATMKKASTIGFPVCMVLTCTAASQIRKEVP